MTLPVVYPLCPARHLPLKGEIGEKVSRRFILKC